MSNRHSAMPLVVIGAAGVPGCAGAESKAVGFGVAVGTTDAVAAQPCAWRSPG